jgi:UDP-N-acetylmuramoyl-tripeptide--D-alanyl-D-alanine ligase
MPATTEIGIIEIGANHPGEHADLMKIVEPTHVLVTNNGADHLEGFGSIEGVRTANKEIYDWARERGITIFVNKGIVDLCEDTENTNRVLYPMSDYKSSSDIYAAVTYDNTLIKTQLVGSLNELNILAAIAVGEYFKIPIAQMVEAFAEYMPTLKRSQLIVQGTTKIVLDCYNANPSSMELSLQDFFKLSNGYKRIIIIGDMLETGETEQIVHLEILNQVKNSIAENDVVLCVGPVFFTFKNDFSFQFFQNSNDAGEIFNELDLSDSYVFLKASRGITLENVVNKKIAL